MKRRDFLKILCVAVTAPSALAKTVANPVASTTAAIAGTPVLNHLTSLDSLLKEIYLPTMLDEIHKSPGFTELLIKHTGKELNHAKTEHRNG